MLTRKQAQDILNNCGIPEGADFHKLDSTKVGYLAEWAAAMKYRKAKNAPGSTARMYHDYLQRRLTAKVKEYVLQGHYGQGWEDLTTESSYSEIRQRLREYRENERGNYRIITRRVMPE